MNKSSIAKAEAKFNALQKKEDQRLSDREIARKESAEKLARLRAQRREKEAADKGGKA